MFNRRPYTEFLTLPHDYNHHRPHSSLGNKTPAEVAGKISGALGWGLTPNQAVAPTPNRGHHSAIRLYS